MHGATMKKAIYYMRSVLPHYTATCNVQTLPHYTATCNVQTLPHYTATCNVQTKCRITCVVKYFGLVFD
jgi:hypothetical protein